MTPDEALVAWERAYDAWQADRSNGALLNTCVIAYDNLIAARLATLPPQPQPKEDDDE